MATHVLHTDTVATLRAEQEGGSVASTIYTHDKHPHLTHALLTGRGKLS